MWLLLLYLCSRLLLFVLVVLHEDVRRWAFARVSRVKEHGGGGILQSITDDI